MQYIFCNSNNNKWVRDTCWIKRDLLEQFLMWDIRLIEYDSLNRWCHVGYFFL